VTPPSWSSKSTAAVRSARLASSSSTSSQPGRMSGGSVPGLLVELQDHSSSPAQWNVETAWPFIPCTFPSELTSISHVPTAIGTVGASRLATATTAPLIALLGNGGPRCRPGVIRSAPACIFSTTTSGVYRRGTIRGLCHSVYTVGYILSNALTQSMRCSPPVPSWLPTYTVPDTCLRSGPAVVVKRADSAFSGRSDFLSAVRPAVDATLSSGSASASIGTSIPKSAMIWSAVRRRSLDFNGESGLI